MGLQYYKLYFVEHIWGGDLMGNIIGTIVGAWFVASACLTGALFVAWLGWAFTRLVRGR